MGRSLGLTDWPACLIDEFQASERSCLKQTAKTTQKVKPNVVAHAFIPSIWEAEAGSSLWDLKSNNQTNKPN